MKNKNLFLYIFGIPIVMGLIGIVGLICALLGDGLWDWLSWLALASLTGVVAFYICRPKRFKEQRFKHLDT